MMKFKEFYMNEKVDKKLYIDMDGVLCDFEEQFYKLVGDEANDYEKEHGEPEFWKAVGDHGEKFWSEMPWMSDGKELWNYVKKFNPTILSTPSRDKRSETGKAKWVKRELGANVPYIFIRAKEKYADSNSILVDDLERKIRRWTTAGGIGVRHYKTKDTIRQLKKLGV